MKEIINSDTLSVSNKVDEILNYIASNNLPITLTSTQIKQYIYRTKGKTKKENLYSQPEIDAIIRNEFLTRKEKFRRIKAINDECTFEKMNNYMISKNIKSFKPYQYIKSKLDFNQNIEDVLKEVNILLENDEHLINANLSSSQKKGLINRLYYGGNGKNKSQSNSSSESDSESI